MSKGPMKSSDKRRSGHGKVRATLTEGVDGHAGASSSRANEFHSGHNGQSKRSR